MEPLVAAIDQAYLKVKDTIQFRGHIIGELTLFTSQKVLATVETLSRLLAEPPVKFSKHTEIREMANDCRQRIEARLQQPARIAPEAAALTDEHGGAFNQLTTLLGGVFVELQEYDEDCAQQQRVLEQLPEMRPYRSKQRNILKVDRVMAWVESTKSELLWINGNNILRRHDFNALFAVPLLLHGQSNCETYLILRHFCGGSYSGARTGFRVLIQALLRQLFQQRPEMVKKKAAMLSQDHVNDIRNLWDLFVECLTDVRVQCIFIVIDSIDFLTANGHANSNEVDEGSFILEQLNMLVGDSTLLIKVLLTAALARESPAPVEGLLALTAYQPACRTGPERQLSLDAMNSDLALVPRKLVEIQEKRCRSIAFAQLPMLYPAYSIVYTTENDQLRARVCWNWSSNS